MTVNSTPNTVDVLAKIETLAAAAVYLTATPEEILICSELLSLIEDMARLAQEVQKHG
ncbi:TPA: hypothetical protein SMI12_004098 [Serratia liquefaciens]|nr:hypothetical protein [Serratia liquefaciens]